VLDRRTGQLILAKNFTPVTWASGVDVKTGRPIEKPGIRYDETGKTAHMLPGALGAHSWQGMAFNPKTGLVYIPAQEVPMTYTAVKDFKPASMGWNIGVATTNVPDVKGYLIAWDPIHQKEAWRTNYLGPWNGGVLTTDGNLVVQGSAAGDFIAYRADSGEKLWSMSAQSAVMAAPVTYEVDGEQYIAVLSGWGGGYPLLEGKPAAKSGNVRNVSRVLAFKLGGNAALPPLEPRQFVINPPADTADSETVAAGGALFGRYCSVCHGESAVGGGVVPDLRASSFLSNDFFFEVVLNGAMKDNGMASFKSILDHKMAEEIRAYVIHRANRDKHADMASQEAHVGEGSR
jgi:quinohemoprotein ethanol dehydrogenase